MHDKIASREPIPSSFFAYSDLFKDTKDLIEKYNSLLAVLVSYFTDKAMGTFISLLFIQDEKEEYLENNLSNYFKLPNEVKE